MDIRKWPLDRIMQLPDCCFGQRYAVSCYQVSLGPAPDWDISEVALPEKCVLWELIFYSVYAGLPAMWFRLALGDQLPTGTGQMDGLSPLIMGLGMQGPAPRRILFSLSGSAVRMKMRKLIETSGRRLVLEVACGGPGSTSIQVCIVVSSIPTEVPDWLCSGNLRSP